MNLPTPLITAAALALLLAAPPVRADTSQVSPGGFTSSFREEVSVPPETVWKSVLQLPRWWNGRHSYSGSAANLSLDAQAKLLRVLQEGAVRPVGATQSVNVDVRIISATHRNLDQMRADRTFREDLFYRLNVVALKLPSLAERREDIPLLVNHFLKKIATRYRKTVPTLAPDALAALVAAPWPGNVRQLENLLEQAVALSTTHVIPLSLIRHSLDDSAAPLVSFEAARKTFERDYLVRILKLTAGNAAQAAQMAGRNRTEFYKLLQRHNLEPGMFKS